MVGIVGGFHMTGKKTVFIILMFTIVILVLAWFWLQHVIEEYDIDRALDSTQLIAQHVSAKYMSS